MSAARGPSGPPWGRCTSAEDEARLQEIDARESAATRGPWRSTWDDPEPAKPSGLGETVIESTAAGLNTFEQIVVGTLWHNGVSVVCSKPDAAFIANAREDVPYLADVVRRRDAYIREVARLLLDEVGTDGPTSAEYAARLAVAEIQGLRREREKVAALEAQVRVWRHLAETGSILSRDLDVVGVDEGAKATGAQLQRSTRHANQGAAAMREKCALAMIAGASPEDLRALPMPTPEEIMRTVKGPQKD